MAVINQKTKFREGPHQSKFNDASATEWFTEAVNAAMLHFLDVTSINPASDQLTAIANGYRLEGARRFRDILITLSEQPQPATVPLRSNLDHNA